MMFARKNPATRALHKWMSDPPAYPSPKGWAPSILDGHPDKWNNEMTALLDAGPDLECNFQGMRPIAWCMTMLPWSRPFVDILLARPSNLPGSLDPWGSIQDVLDAARTQLKTEHISRTLCAVIAWSRNIPPSTGANANLLSSVVSLHPEVDPHVLEKLRAHGYDPNIPSGRGYTVAHATVANRANAKALAWSIKHCNLEALDMERRTPLALALELHATNAVNALLEAGADPRHPSVSLVIETKGPDDPSFAHMYQRVQASASQAGLAQSTTDRGMGHGRNPRF